VWGVVVLVWGEWRGLERVALLFGGGRRFGLAWGLLVGVENGASVGV